MLCMHIYLCSVLYLDQVIYIYIYKYAIYIYIQQKMSQKRTYTLEFLNIQVNTGLYAHSVYITITT